ncbi:MAG TPA: hypothetical protein GX717_02520, partial [Clostridiaceae bacterium]|nr:hypothetical protein [Clostridiaceae bacterium]
MIFPVNGAAMIDANTLVIVILSLCGALALIGLFVVFIKVAGTISKVNNTIDEILPSVKETTDKLPETVDHINATLGNVVDLTDSMADTVPVLLESTAKM